MSFGVAALGVKLVSQSTVEIANASNITRRAAMGNCIVDLHWNTGVGLKLGTGDKS